MSTRAVQTHEHSKVEGDPSGTLGGAVGTFAVFGSLEDFVEHSFLNLFG